MKSAWALLLLLLTLPAHGEVGSCTPAELRAHLEQLKALVAACEQRPTAAVCNPAAVGPDNKVALPAGARLVRYDWLRPVLEQAGKKQKAVPGLNAAEARLSRELDELASPGQVPAAELQRERLELSSILSSGEFPPPRRESLWRRLLDVFFGWMNRLLSQASGSGTHTGWGGILLIGAVILAACGGLVWWFRRTVRTRYALQEGVDRSSDGRLSEKADWRAWLDEAQGLADEERWQESIHRVYWAAVAQLESRGLWRHDAARTPREYLELVSAGSAMRGDLEKLTWSLEKFWYAGQPAGQQDYLQVRAVLDRLVNA